MSCSVAPESSGGAYKGHRPPYVKLEEEQQYKFKHTEEQYKYKQAAEEYKTGEEYKVDYKQPLRALPAQPNQYHLPPLTAAPQVGGGSLKRINLVKHNSNIFPGDCKIGAKLRRVREEGFVHPLLPGPTPRAGHDR